MASLQQKINGDGTISIIIPTLSHPLYGISLDELDVLPKELGAEEFCGASQLDKLWELRSISFDKPANESRRLKQVVEVISAYVSVVKEKRNADHKYAMLVADQQKRQKELEELKKKIKTPPAPSLVEKEYVANLSVETTINAREELVAETPTTDGYNRLLVEAFDKLPEEDKVANSQLIKSTFSGYYLTASGLKKVVVEFIV